MPPPPRCEHSRRHGQVQNANRVVPTLSENDFIAGFPTVGARSGNAHGGAGFASLRTMVPGNGFEFLQVRISVHLPSTIGPFEPGSYQDHWSIRFDHGQ